MHLTIAYMTSRKDPKSQWFFDSLAREIKDGPLPKVVVIDFYSDKSRYEHGLGYVGQCVNTPPKPSVWQGTHRLTSVDHFAAANARNTALCLAPDGFIAFVDDLSVLQPGWYQAIKDAMAGNYIACGAYRKVKKLVVENGEVKSYEPFSDDNRLSLVSQDVTPCGGNWLYGCSVAGPVEAFLSVNGWPEDLCDGMGFEDCCMGIVLANAGWQLKYDRRMMTFESEEHHHGEGAAFKKDDYHFENGKPVRGGNGGTDKSHAVLNIAYQSKRFPNSFDIRELRAKTLVGEPFPIMKSPEHEWFTSIPLKDL